MSAYRDGKGSLYEGGTRVAALANWPGHIKTGVVDQMMHVVDMYPTLLAQAGGKLGKNKPLDGMDVWTTINQGAPSPRTEIVYNLEPYRAGIRQGDWKLVAAHDEQWHLYDLSKDRAENYDLAEKNPDKAKELEGLWQKKLAEFQELTRSEASEKPQTKNRGAKKK